MDSSADGDGESPGYCSMNELLEELMNTCMVHHYIVTHANAAPHSSVLGPTYRAPHSLHLLLLSLWGDT